MKVERINLSDELRRIAGEMDRAGSSRTAQYTCSKYDSDLLRDAAAKLAAAEREQDKLQARVDRLELVLEHVRSNLCFCQALDNCDRPCDPCLAAAALDNTPLPWEAAPTTPG